MKPLLKPNKGWKYRVIICTEEEIVVHDDVMYPQQIQVCAKNLVSKELGLVT